MDEINPQPEPGPQPDPEPFQPAPELHAAELAAAPVLYLPNQDERTFATLAHALQMVGWWIAPLIIFLVKRESLYVKFHALQALLLQIIYAALGLVTVVIFIAIAVGSAVHGGLQNQAQPPAALFVMFPLFWLGGLAMWAIILTVTIVYSIKAGKGEWANYPVLGPLARYFLGIKA